MSRKKPAGIRNAASIASYDGNAEQFVESYERLRFEEAHAGILDLLPTGPAHVLDVGAGSGRDAAALAKRGFSVTAVEPGARMRELAKTIHRDANIKWMDDKLPALAKIRRMGVRYSFILLSAVWMHLRPKDRDRAMSSLSKLLDERGLLVITLRLGQPEVVRGIYPVSEGEVVALARKYLLKLIRVGNNTADLLSRPDLQWRTIVLGKTISRLRHL